MIRTPALAVQLRPITSASSDENKEQKANDEEKQKGQQTGEPKNFGLLLFGISLALQGLATIQDRHQATAPETDMDTLVQRLERGEIDELYLIFNKVFIRYRPETNRQLEMVRLKILPLAFQDWIRKKERKWGISAENCVPINSNLPFELSLANPNHSGFIVSVLFSSMRIALSVIAALSIIGYLLPQNEVVIKYFTTKTLNKPRKPSKPSDVDMMDDLFGRSNRRGAGDAKRRPVGGTGGFSPFFDMLSDSDSMQPVTSNVRFEDVAGMHACKQEVMEFVSFLKDRTKYQLLGAKLPKGALLLGPPGTGKTLLVKALANEANVPFFNTAGSEFVEMIGGLGASRIRKLFRNAKSQAPSIVFIDELDSIGRSRQRDNQRSGGGVTELEQTLNQLLVEMDGMDTSQSVIVFAATNRADLLDKALLRAGRFDRHIFVDLPNLAERKELFAMYIAKCRLAPSVQPEELIEHFAKWTPGMSGADIARLCNEAALFAVRRDPNAENVTRGDFEQALERVLVGSARQNNPLSPPERHVAAVHEAGRALVAWLLPHTGCVPVKVSIVPRTTASTGGSGHLGFTQIIPEERIIYTAEQLNDRMTIMLGGRAAEQVMFDGTSDASERHLREASSLAMRQVREFGLSKIVGNLSFQDNSGGLKPYSQRTQSLIEAEAQRLVCDAFRRGVDLLTTNKGLLQSVISALLKKEVLTREELIEICEHPSLLSGQC